MTVDLETRLEHAVDALPLPDAAAHARARAGALEALPSPRPRRGRRRTFLAFGAAASAVAALAALALAAPWEGTSPFTTERALAAIGDQPVIHAVVENDRPWATIVDLSTGEELPQRQLNELWFDGERGLLRVRSTLDEKTFHEFLQTREGGLSSGGPFLGPPTEPRLDPALAGFVTRYREALESGRAHIVSEVEVDARAAVRLEIPVRSAEPRDVAEEVDVDADTYRPLRFRFVLNGNPLPWWRVVSIATLPRADGQFTPPPPAPTRPQAQTYSDEREVTAAAAAGALDRPTLWPGRVVAGIELTRIELLTLTTLWTDGRETTGPALRLRYGPGRAAGPSERWLEVEQATSREHAPRFGPWPDPAPAPGRIQLLGFGDQDGSAVDTWLASLERDGVFLTFRSSERGVVLAAARALARIPGGG